MPARLAVVMIQTTPATVAGASGLSESIVGEVIGRPGIDLTLIGTLAAIRDDSTDRLTLESLNGDVAVLDWQSPAEIIESLQRQGFTGLRTPHLADPDAVPPGQPGRRIYAVDLRQFESAGAVSDALMKLLAGRQINPVSIGGPPSSRAQPVAGAPTMPTPRRVAEAEPDAAAARQPADESSHRASRPSLDLDVLVDQLDELDP